MQDSVIYNKENIFSFIRQLDYNQKSQIFDLIKDEIFQVRFQNLLDQCKTNDISPEEIINEVEYVRSKRYESSN